MNTKNNDKAMNEAILGWFKRENPDHLWALADLPSDITFADMKASMEAGDGMGRLYDCGDTRTREMMLERLAEIEGKSVDKLIGWANANFKRKNGKAA